ncbi:hypothetical protein [Virgibacillus salexigens]|uniref:hypothetical protein n=1 Tax=Virgibacillus salexigens TaxID=61016 RepID=UPI003081467A
MKLSEFMSEGIMHRKAKLLMDINLNNGESRKKGEIVSVLKNYGGGYYHIEDNEFACKASDSEIEFI